LVDTIAAVSTPPGRGAISIVRVSGPDAIRIADRITRIKSPKTPPSEWPSHRIRSATIVFPGRGGEVVDQAMMAVMRSPRSYTGQDMVEIYCHGNPDITGRVLEAVVKAGARLAGRGEFTKQAFLFGKMDLAQAESVIELINAGSRLAARAALDNLTGRLSRKLREWWGRLQPLFAELEARIEFPEDDIEPLDFAGLGDGIADVLAEMKEVLAASRAARPMIEGYVVTITGPPNSGKSTLLNRMLNRDRAIVSSIAGTTRDVLEADLELDGVVVRLVDTAGLRDETRDEIERIGIERAERSIAESDLVLYLVDASCCQEAGGKYKEIERDKRVLVPNKLDLTGGKVPECYWQEYWDEGMVGISALTGDGLAELKEMIKSRLGMKEERVADELIVTRTRHLENIGKAAESLERALEMIEQRSPEELISYEVRGALDSLAELTGDRVAEDLLERIFSDFCVGK